MQGVNSSLSSPHEILSLEEIKADPQGLVKLSRQLLLRPPGCVPQDVLAFINGDIKVLDVQTCYEKLTPLEKCAVVIHLVGFKHYFSRLSSLNHSEEKGDLKERSIPEQASFSRILCPFFSP